MLPLFSFQFDNFIIKSFLNFNFIALLTFNWTEGSCSFLFVSGRVYDGKESKWQCTDIEIQRHVIRSISSFLDCISGDTTHHPLVKDSLADIVGAIVWILQNKSKAVLSMATNAVVNLINVVPNSLLQSYLLDMVHPLSSLLLLHQVDVSISCATALNMIFSNLSVKGERKVWDILIETESVSRIASGIREFSDGVMPIECFKGMASLLSTILHRWPPSRYTVWNDAKLLEVLEVMRVKPDFSVKVAVMKLYTTIALCGNGAKKLLEKGESLLHIMVLCMGRSHPISVRIEGFRLAQCLAKNEEGCLKMMSLCCDPFVKAIIDGMSGWTSHSGKIANDQMSLLLEACHLALISRWAGEHHDCLWEHGIDRVLLKLLLHDFQDEPLQQLLSLEEQLSIAREGLKANFLLGLRPYVWDLLGWLAIHCREDFNPNIQGCELRIGILITCACISFVDSIRKGHQICQNDVADTLRSEAASRAVMMMIYSPCKYIATKASDMLYEILRPTSKEHLKRLMHMLKIRPSMDNVGMPNMLQTSINLVALVCYSGIPQYQSHIVENGGIHALMDLIWWCLRNDIHIGRLSLAPHLHNTLSERTCCWICKEDWEGNNILLLYGLWGLAELMHSGSSGNTVEIFGGQVDYTEAQFVSTLQGICSDNSGTSPGIKWDVMLEAKANESISWTCTICSKSVPHMHCHKVVLWSRCDYLRALLQSGMRESNSQTIKVPVSWEAMIRLVNWLYTDELPRPPSGCLWINMKSEERLAVLQPYLELCRLAEFWFLEEVQDISYRVIVSCVDSARHLSIKIIKIAADFCIWKLVEVAANFLAPSYRQLCQSGELEALDEEVIDMIRTASVRLSQEG
ncbi:BTB/POZ domain-containing protein At1g04390 isoform X10 [Manihot esculenta]|uniref:BTB/POZ domain-containing protein At1g04390 isoform X10 n=1 Tax=Manihot esculenta TaxID=3983 RepID=UPI000B5D3495|nr:BTB/POZ domain-containing protein At1g04390 isoform X10 [Manihot esculenta]